MFAWMLAIRDWFYQLVYGKPKAMPVTLTDNEMLAYLVEQRDGSPSRYQLSSEAYSTRRHDWGTSPGSRGFEASDSVLRNTPARNTVIQTFDFGYSEPGFGRFDLQDGDGGQVLVIVDGWASVIMTQDGGDGVQWFIGRDRSQLGWLMFRNTVTDAWQSVDAELAKGRHATDRPLLYNEAYTRFRRQMLSMPFARAGVFHEMRNLDVIVCEHYSGGNPETAEAVERFVFAKGLGWVLWERWQQNVALPTEVVAANAARLPALPELEAPLGEGWTRNDGRCWTNICEYATPVSVDMFAWPALSELT